MTHDDARRRAREIVITCVVRHRGFRSEQVEEALRQGYTFTACAECIAAALAREAQNSIANAVATAPIGAGRIHYPECPAYRNTTIGPCICAKLGNEVLRMRKFTAKIEATLTLYARDENEAEELARQRVAIFDEVTLEAKSDFKVTITQDAI